MGSHPCLPRPSVCGSLEPTVRSRRSSSSTWILPSRGSVCPFSHPCFQWITLFARQDRYSLLFSFLSLSPPCVPTAGQRNILPFFCLLASISLCMTSRHRHPSWRKLIETAEVLVGKGPGRIRGARGANA